MTTADQHVTGADALLRVLEAWGVDHVFTCPGSTEAAFLEASHAHPGVRVLLTTHEAVAVSMADGYARATGRPGVAYLHANVGLANGIAHLYAAELGRSPVVLLTGIKPRSLQNRRGFTTTPHMRDSARQHVKSEWQVLRADALAEDAVRALKAAMAAPRGPVWLGIAQDLLEAEVPAPVLDVDRFRVAARTRPAADAVRAGAALLADAARPLVVAGSELASSGGIEAAVQLAERLGGPVVAEDRRTFERSAFPADHPCFAGLYGADRSVLGAADLVVLAGARSSVPFEPTTTRDLPPDARVVHLHPDPDEIARSEGVDVALVADAALGMADLVEGLGDHRPRPSATRFLADARAEYDDIRVRVLGAPSGTDGVLRVPELMVELAAAADERTTVVGDATTSGGTLLHAMATQNVQVHTSSSGSLGWGMGAALGFALADRSRRVLAVVGDGVVQFGLPALWSAAHDRIPVTLVVVNNRSYAAVGAALRRYDGTAFRAGRMVGVDISGPDLAAIAAGFGMASVRVHERAEVKAALAEWLPRDEPCLIEVLTDPRDFGP
ncbi:thiamine pyrophosphate-binding protein [soil metagenome]